MTDFMQEPLWEEEGKEPDLPKAKEVEKDDPLAAAGNAAIAQVLPEVKEAAEVPPMPEKPKVPEPRDMKHPKPEEEPALDWETPLVRVIAAFGAPGLGKHLPPLLEVAHAIPPERVQAVAGSIVAAFLKLPAEARKPVRDVLVIELKRWPALPLARLILTRLGGIPAPASDPPPPPPPPPADS